jgi:hypothetical protein
MPEPFSSAASVTVGTNLTMQVVYQSLSTPTTRGKIGEVDISCPATPADQIAEFYFNRTTSAGSTGTAITPSQDDPAGPAGQFLVNSGAFGTEPTYTSGKTVWRLNCHQRNTVRWIPRDGKEPMLIATQNDGLGLRSLSFSSGTGVAYDTTLSWTE